MEGRHAQDPDTTSLYPANMGHGEVMGQRQEGVVWRWGEGKTCFGVPAQALLGDTSYWDDIPPKRGKVELEPLGACHER